METETAGSSMGLAANALKVCTGCCEPQSLTAFYKNRKTKDGLRQRCITCTKAQNKAGYAANREAWQERSKAWKAANKQKYAEQQAGYYLVNKEHILARHAKTRAADLLKYRAIESRYHKANPHVTKQAHAKRRALRKGAPVVERIVKRAVYDRDGGTCYLCTKPVAFEDMHLEHIVPLAKGGEHSYRNVATSCGPCNLKKGTKLLPIEPRPL